MPITDTDKSPAATPWEPQAATVGRGNPFGATALAASLLAMIFGWVPVVGWSIWLAALALSLTGLTRQPRWPAVTALVISVTIMAFAVVVTVAGSDAIGSFIRMLSN